MMHDYLCDRIFTYHALDELDEKLKRATTLEDFYVEVDYVASQPGQTLELATPIIIDSELGSSPSDDGETAIAVLEGVGYIDLANATDPRLWSYLALITMRDYVERRWPGTEADFRNNIKQHSLLLSRSKRLMLRHAIARLWWVANLTADPQLEHPASQEERDPYAYTRWAWAGQNRIRAFFERNLGSNDQIRWAILEELESMDRDFTKTDVDRIAKEIHLLSGFQILEVKSSPGLREIVGSAL